MKKGTFLKPCPFCGGSGCATLMHQQEGLPLIRITCLACGSGLRPQHSSVNAILLWNSRPFEEVRR